MQKPKTCYWLVFLVLYAYYALSHLYEWQRVQQLNPAAMSAVDIVTFNTNPVIELLFAIPFTLLICLVIAWPIDYYRRRHWRKANQVSKPNPNLLDIQPDDGQLPNMKRKVNP